MLLIYELDEVNGHDLCSLNMGMLLKASFQNYVLYLALELAQYAGWLVFFLLLLLGA